MAAWRGPMSWRDAVMRCWYTIPFLSRADGCGLRTCLSVCARVAWTRNLRIRKARQVQCICRAA